MGESVYLKGRIVSNAGMGVGTLESTSDLCLGSIASMNRYGRRRKNGHLGIQIAAREIEVSGPR